MKQSGGYAGSILFIDLTEGKVSQKRLSESIVSGFIGGIGGNIRLAYDLIKPGIDPLSPDNVLIFGAGPFVGTNIPGACRTSVAAKSPSSGFLGSSGSGHFGALKFTGFDHVVITGKSDRPVYLKIGDEGAEIIEAGHIWGKDVWEATDEIWRESRGEFAVQCIGQAGENLVRDAAIICNKYAASARTGLGAVMGSKNLKAIAACGSGGVKVAQPDTFSRLAEALHKQMRELMALPDLQGQRTYGSARSLEPLARLGMMPYRNWTGAITAQDVNNSYDLKVFLDRFKGSDIACMSCPIGCKHLLRVKDGRYKGLVMPISCAATATIYFGGNCGITDWQEVWRCEELCNRLGLDIITTGALVSFAIELYEKGIIDRSDTAGLELGWGKAETIHELIRQIALRRDFGDVLADGLKGAPDRIGKGSHYYAQQVKGEAPIFDPRPGVSPATLEQSTNFRGHQTYAGTVKFSMSSDQLRDFCRKMKMPEETIAAVVANPQGNVGKLSKWPADYVMATESLGLCSKISMRGINVDTSIDFWADLYSALTGIKTDSARLLRAGENAHDLARAFNVREGASSSDDVAPERCVKESLKMGVDVFDPVDEQYFSLMVKQYYQERGWDPEEGTVNPGRIAELTR